MTLPKGWAQATLDELTKPDSPICYGVLKPGDPNPGGVRMVRVTDIRRNELDESKLVTISDALDIEFHRSRVAARDVLISVQGTVGRVALVPPTLVNANISRTIARIRTADEIDPRWVWRALLAPQFQNTSTEQVAGTTRDSLNIGALRELRLPVPPVAEQRRIVEKLDALTSRLARARAELDRTYNLARNLRNSARAAAASGELTRDFRSGEKPDWPEQTLCNVAKVVTGSTPPSADKERFFGGAIPFFKPTDLDAGYHVFVPRETLTNDGAERSRIVPAGSVLVTCIGATIAKTGLSRVACAFNQQINAVVPKTDVVQPEWLFWAITSPAFRTQIIDNASATTLPIINKGRFQQLPLRVPPLAEQKIIVARLEAIHARADRLEAESARARALLDRMEAAILARAFRGELVPQDTADEPASAMLDRIRAHRAAAPKVRGRRAGARA